MLVKADQKSDGTPLTDIEIVHRIHDLIPWPIELMRTITEWEFSTTACLFVVKVTSPVQQKRDFETTARYARANVPTYLLVDRSRRECVVFTDPEDGRYLTVHHVPFGKPVDLALYKAVTIDTSEF